MSSKDRLKIRCEKCYLPFWSAEQLEKHLLVHERQKTFSCLHCNKIFARSDRCKMHMRACDDNPNRERTTFTMQIGRGVNNDFRFLNQALSGVFQTWRYEFSDEEQKDMYASLRNVVMNSAYDLVIEATSTFKWYLGLQVNFHKAADPTFCTQPPVFFQSNPSPSYKIEREDEETWENALKQLEKQIEEYESNGSGWVLSQLVLLDVIFCEMENPLQPRRMRIHEDSASDTDYEVED